MKVFPKNANLLIMFPFHLQIEANRDLILSVTLSPKNETIFLGTATAGLKKLVYNFLEKYPNAPLPPLDWHKLPPFSMKVLQALLQIPCGSVKSYKEIAEIVGSPKAARAVGQVCRRNLFPFFVPCHRVVASQGLGGFLFGLDKKQALLDFERKLIF